MAIYEGDGAAAETGDSLFLCYVLTQQVDDRDVAASGTSDGTVAESGDSQRSTAGTAPYAII